MTELNARSTSQAAPNLAPLPVAALFEQQVSETPDRLALKGGDRRLSFDALNRAANRLARVIISECGPGAEPVALLMENGADVIIAIIAVLKAGKFYVPLDASFPTARLETFLADSTARLVITNGRNLEAARQLAHMALRIICIEQAGSITDETNLGLEIAPDTLLNISYTSGSTGHPKGVTQSQKNAARWRTAAKNAHSPGGERIALLRSASFGASAATIFRTLFAGSALFPFDVRIEGLRRLADFIRDEQITSFGLVPTVFRGLMSILADDERLPSVRSIGLGGEAIYKRDIVQFRKHFSEQAAIHYTFGTTEAYNIAGKTIDAHTPIDDKIIPVGPPSPGVEVMVLDDQHRSLAPGEVGELAVRSQQVSPGYWRQTELNSSAFLPDPEGGNKPIYLLGDLGRIRSDGQIELLGRKDQMVKIHGQQVVLTEVESALRELPAVKDAAVVARADPGGERRLAAYWVPATIPPAPIADLRAALARIFPEHAIPSAFVRLEAMPMTQSSKIDRAALPQPGRERSSLSALYVAPQTPLEKRLAGIWSDVLHIEKIGAYDPFLELGGDSLLAAKVAARVLENLGLEMPVAILLGSETIAEMAVVVAAHMVRALPPETGAALVQRISE